MNIRVAISKRVMGAGLCTAFISAAACSSETLPPLSDAQNRIASELVFWGFDAREAQQAIGRSIPDRYPGVHRRVLFRFAYGALRTIDPPAPTPTEYMLDFAERAYDDELAPPLLEFWQEHLASDAYQGSLKGRVEAAVESTRENVEPLLQAHRRLANQIERQLRTAKTAERRTSAQAELDAINQAIRRLSEPYEIIHEGPGSRLVSENTHLYSEWTPDVASESILPTTPEPSKPQQSSPDTALDTKIEELETTPLTFSFGGVKLSKRLRKAIKAVAAVLKANSALKLEVSGHSDSRGPARGNLRVSQKRADIVVAKLVSMGIDPIRLAAIGRGSAYPRKSNATRAGRAANRRAELKFVRPLPPPKIAPPPPPAPPPEALAVREHARTPPSAFEVGTPKHLRDYVKRWLGTPYQYGGKSRAAGGVDSSGFVRVVFREAYGIELPPTTTLQAYGGHAQNKAKLQTGDLVFFDIPMSGRITHVGIYVDAGIMAHASLGRGVTYDRFETKSWVRRFSMARRYLPKTSR